MKTKTIIIIVSLALALGAGIGIHLNRMFSPSPAPAGKLQLEEVLSIKELHLVKHTYHDLFFLYRKNDADNSIRAIIDVPVTVTAYINLKDIMLVKKNDTIRTVILPQAKLNQPAYDLNKMIVRKTRSVQIHVGKDLYPEVSRYLNASLVQRIDSVSNIAVQNQILEQAEAEGKEYIETILKGVGRRDVRVTFGDAVKDERIANFQMSMVEGKNTNLNTESGY